MIFEFCFYFYIIRETLYNKKIKNIVRIIPFLFVLFAAFNIIFIQKITVFNTITYAFGALIIVATCVYFFFELFQLSYPVNIARLPAFWICAGLLFFYACTFPVFGLANFMQSAPWVIIRNLKTIVNLLNIFLYSSFIIAFLCGIRVRNSTS